MFRAQINQLSHSIEIQIWRKPYTHDNVRRFHWPNNDVWFSKGSNQNEELSICKELVSGRRMSSPEPLTLRQITSTTTITRRPSPIAPPHRHLILPTTRLCLVNCKLVFSNDGALQLPVSNEMKRHGVIGINIDRCFTVDQIDENRTYHKGEALSKPNEEYGKANPTKTRAPTQPQPQPEEEDKPLYSHGGDDHVEKYLSVHYPSSIRMKKGGTRVE